ncbi:MAG: VCBS repeat-containing protein [Myxococcales bacterium]|nr:VCBS repeat-containing protein [Myxococcales bacterium]
MHRRRIGARAGSALAPTLALLLITAACTSLPGADPGTCGNGLVEPALGEDCDRPGADCGQAGTTAACRLLCASDADCPATAVCDAAGTCVVADGRFVRADEQVVNAEYLLIGDLDGAGDPDLVLIDDVRIDVRTGAAGAGFAATALVPNQPLLSAPTAGDFNDDGKLDVVTSVGFALNLMLGDEAELLSPTLQPTVSSDAISGPFRTARFRYTVGGRRGLATAFVATLAFGVDCPLLAGCPVIAIGAEGYPLNDGRDPDRLVTGPIPWAWFPPTAGTEPSVALAALVFADGPGLDDSSAIDLYRVPVAPGAAGALLPVGSITGQDARAASVGDVDGDGRNDVAITSELLGGRVEVRIARGTATGFEPPRRLRLRAQGSPGIYTDAPDAVAWLDLNGDGTIDLVTADGGLALACGAPGVTWDCETTELVRVGSFDETWVRATQGDLNGDGRADLIAVRSSLNTLDVFLAGSPVDSFTAAPFLVSAPVSAVWTGDFDGNGADDVAMLTDTDAPARVDLRIAYGVIGGVPGAAIRTGALQRPAAIAVEHVGLLTPPDGAEDLILYDEHAGGGVDLTFVLGSASQRMSAPLYPATEPAAPDGSLLAIPAVVAVPLEGADVIAALAVQLTPRFGLPDVHSASVRFYRADASGRMTERRAGAVDAAGLALLGAQVTVLARPGELPRVIAIDAAGKGFVVPVTGCPDACALMTSTPLGGSGGLGAPIALSTVAIDDGGLALVALVGTDVGGAEVLIWRDLAAEPERVPLPASTLPLSIAAIAPPGGGPRSLVIATLNRALLVSTPGADGRYPPPVEAGAAGLIDQPVRTALSVRSVDVDGDHVEDLVVGVGPDVERLRQVVTYTQGHVPGGAGLAAGEGQ